MRFGYVLLGLVTLTSLHISSGQCSNGLAGVQNEDICCDADCGTCGGHDCGQQTGGADACCIGRISDSGEMCSSTMAAPCIIDDEEVPEPTCSNGLPGVQDGSVCCADFCGTCGGCGCAEIPNGEHNCCAQTIRASGRICSETMEAPCLVVDEDVPETTCSNGLPGVQSSSVCCAAFCGTCGGRGCAAIPNGEHNCCAQTIRASGRICSETMEAPCLVDDEVPEVCSNGVPGVEQDGFCCAAQCETCGGGGCATRPGGRDACCTGRIEASGIFCSDTPVAPCIMD